jgi:hypothetical protein
MKKIFLIILFFSFNLFAQRGRLNLIFDDDRVIVYNGTELITNEIDRTLEPSAEKIANGLFGSNVTSWTGNSCTLKWYNTDWNAVGRTMVMLDSLTSTTSTSFIANSNSPAYSQVKLSYRYYILATNTTAKGIKPRLYFSAGANTFGVERKVLGAWTYVQENIIAANSATWTMFFYPTNGSGTLTGTSGDKLYIDDVSVKQISNYISNGNHTIDTTSAYKQAGSYGCSIVASAAGNGTTNTISLASTLFTAVTNGSAYRLQLYAYTSTANTTLTFKLGDIVKTAIVSTVGMTEIDFDFKATASTTGNILLYLDKAATVYIDELSLKSGQ